MAAAVSQEAQEYGSSRYKSHQRLQKALLLYSSSWFGGSFTNPKHLSGDVAVCGRIFVEPHLFGLDLSLKGLKLFQPPAEDIHWGFIAPFGSVLSKVTGAL